jgi:putative peptide zinc metalloprotease protein
LSTAPVRKCVADTELLQPGTGIAKSEALLQVISPQGVRVTAFIDAPDAQRTPRAPTAKFIADQPGLVRLDGRAATTDRINMATLEFPALASAFGGPIPTAVDPPLGQTAAKPLSSLLRVRIEGCQGVAGVVRELPGIAVLEGAAESLLGRAWRAALALRRRESGL